MAQTKGEQMKCLIIAYTLVCGGVTVEIEEKVQAKIKSGWQPLGGLSMKPYYTCQTMVKYKCEDK